MGLRTITRLLALTSPPSTPRPATRPSAPPSPDVVVLKHCRCMDCRKFSQAGSDYFCDEHMGGTAIVWSTGKRTCDPPPDVWQYCACYDGPQISKDVWVWRRSRHVGPGSNISGEVEQTDEVLI